MKQSSREERLVVVQYCNTGFEAEALVVLLADHGIMAYAEGTNVAANVYKDTRKSIPVRVRETQLELARLTIEDARADAAEIDWNAIDVGERVDRIKLAGETDLTPIWFRTVATVAILVLTVSLITAIAWLVLS